MPNSSQEDLRDPYTVPANIVGAEAIRALHDNGYRVVPVTPTRGMLQAAVEVLGRWVEGQPRVGSREKAGLRYGAMLRAWTKDYEGLRVKAAKAPPPQPQIKIWTWRNPWRRSGWLPQIELKFERTLSRAEEASL